ncbi:hypothetical protein K469DRAFT_700290 [Zopfia rhizophila CBS 207.26]|uniref:HMG box domain-containing protein n=1 Tax=Zopfia rhizophila CBS 207.26 TaxID=1314779 RepID=A0A6A6D9Q7_9PEZI|nr:hypothetical protein K469DRAFT_700290 [Zopfia rhizophila CBS 207.26]
MNCFMLFREYEHKLLKALHPHLCTQEISKILSEKWKNLTGEERAYWKAEAIKTKEEHQRLHPDYKYSPRKPGQKKKRQSRKAIQAAVSTSFPEASMLTSNFNPVSEASIKASISSAPATDFRLEIFDFNSFPGTSMLTPDTNPTSEAAANVFTTHIGNALPSDAAWVAETMGLQSLESQEPLPPMSATGFYDAEARRQSCLEAEFGAEFATEHDSAELPTELLAPSGRPIASGSATDREEMANDDIPLYSPLADILSTYVASSDEHIASLRRALRVGADENATLPAFSSANC